eukprot:CAMPEP_0175007830 /NCGR_PEP_ID=MMETSP0005-20121125/6642_1 /TAXON_ID=420556 /ORGANISM="Ochromonas sp., Strain CCMP1393" /LENGTH=173 /DNA_ID=CAMNT_0016263341 /DNA_START=760 /DNA_END=1281 /DNA_ORIENTATION=-
MTGKVNSAENKSNPAYWGATGASSAAHATLWIADQSCSESNTKSCANIALLSSDHKRNKGRITLILSTSWPFTEQVLGSPSRSFCEWGVDDLIALNSPDSAVRCCFSAGSSSTGGSRPLALAACRQYSDGIGRFFTPTNVYVADSSPPFSAGGWKTLATSSLADSLTFKTIAQ